MNLRDRKQKLIAEINITPFTDVILVLLIIFMITTPLMLQSGLKVNLPKAKSAQQIKNAKAQVSVTITNEGLIYLDEKMATKKELKEQISGMHRDNPELEVVLLSDKMVRFKDIVSVLDILNDLGINKLNISAKTED